MSVIYAPAAVSSPDLLIKHAREGDIASLYAQLFSGTKPVFEALVSAVKAGKNDCLRALVKASGEEVIKEEDEWGGQPLHWAAMRNNVEAIKILTQIQNKSAILEKQNKSGSTPLHQAAALDLEDAARALIQAGANIYAMNSQGRFPGDITTSQAILSMIRDEQLRLSALGIQAPTQTNLAAQSQTPSSPTRTTASSKPPSPSRSPTSARGSTSKLNSPVSASRRESKAPSKAPSKTSLAPSRSTSPSRQ